MSRDRVYLRHILEAIEKIESYVDVGRNVFLATSHWHDATIRQLEIIGEATKRISHELRARSPHMPWRQRRLNLVYSYAGQDYGRRIGKRAGVRSRRFDAAQGGG